MILLLNYSAEPNDNTFSLLNFLPSSKVPLASCQPRGSMTKMHLLTFPIWVTRSLTASFPSAALFQHSLRAVDSVAIFTLKTDSSMYNS